MIKLKELFRRHLIVFILTMAGAAGGFLYWKYIGCLSGTCPIKSVWYLSTLFGLLLGYFAGGIAEDMLIKYDKKGKTRENI